MATVELYFGWEEIRPEKGSTEACPPWHLPHMVNDFHTHNPVVDAVMSVWLDRNEWWTVDGPCDTPPIVLWWRVIGAVFTIIITTLLIRLFMEWKAGK